MEDTPSWSVTEDRARHPLKQDAGILVMPLGTVTLVRAVQPAKR